MRVLAILGGVLEKTHGTDVVLSDVVTRASLGRIPEVDRHSIHHERYHACQVLDKVAIKDLHHWLLLLESALSPVLG